jgi:hypothetical protein
MILNAREHRKIVQKVFIDDIDITQRCFCLDTENEWVMLWPTWPPTLYDATNEIYELKVGKVRVVFTPEAQTMFDAGGILE